MESDICIYSHSCSCPSAQMHPSKTAVRTCYVFSLMLVCQGYFVSLQLLLCFLCSAIASCVGARTTVALLCELHLVACCRFPVVLSPADVAEEAAEYHPLLAFTVISQPGLARGQTYYPLISFQISKTLQVHIGFYHCITSA